MLTDICIDCGHDLRTPPHPPSCVGKLFKVDGRPVAPKRHDNGHSCPDCHVEPGSYHHPGCEYERCPVCGGQVVGCACVVEDGP